MTNPKSKEAAVTPLNNKENIVKLKNTYGSVRNVKFDGDHMTESKETAIADKEIDKLASRIRELAAYSDNTSINKQQRSPAARINRKDKDLPAVEHESSRPVGEDEVKPTSHANKQMLDMEWRAIQIRNHLRAEIREKLNLGIKEK